MLTIPPEASRWLNEHSFGQVDSQQSVPGGCINQGAILKTNRGRSVFIKQNQHTPGDMFRREAEGLRALRTDKGPRIPEAYAHGRDFLLLEDLSPAPAAKDYWEKLGNQLAHVHRQTSPKFGFDHDNYIGSTPQPNSRHTDGYAFFAENRLRFQARLAVERGYLNTDDLEQLESIVAQLKHLIPQQPASLLHGDLWSGNAITDSEGEPALIDPAVHYGWAEAELGMTALFGGFPDRFYLAYLEVHPLQPGWRERFPIYNLYHLLNHLNLFGSGYLGPVRAILRRFS